MESGRKRTLILSSILFVIATCMGVTMGDAKRAARFEASSESINPDTDQLNLTCAIGSSEKDTSFQIRNTVKSLAAIDVYLGTQDFGNDLQVEGNILDPMRELFLRVIIPNPGEADAGNYSCLVYVEREGTLVLETTVQWLDDTDMKLKLISFKDEVSSLNAEIEHQWKQMEIQYQDTQDIVKNLLHKMSLLENLVKLEQEEVSNLKTSLVDQGIQLGHELSNVKNRLQDQRNELANTKTQVQNCAIEINTTKNTTVSFHAVSKSKSIILPGQTLVYSDVIDNIGGGYNGSEGVFTAPVAGYYLFSISVTSSMAKAIDVEIKSSKSGKMARVYTYEGHSVDFQETTCVSRLEAGERVWPRVIWANKGASLWIVSSEDRLNKFYGFLMKMV